MPAPAAASAWVAVVAVAVGAGLVLGSGAVLAAPGAAAKAAPGTAPAAPAPAAPAAPAPAPAAAGAAEVLSVRVPEVATSADDGLPPVLRRRLTELSLPVWRAPGTAPVSAALVVDHRTCATAVVAPGEVARLRCMARATGRTLRVTVVADGRPLGAWTHTVAVPPGR